MKSVNPLESVEDRIVIHIWIDFYVHPSFLFLFSKAVQHGLTPLLHLPGGGVYHGLLRHEPGK